MGGGKNVSELDTKTISSELQQIKDIDCRRYCEVVSFLNVDRAPGQCGFEHVTTVVRSIPNKRMPSKTSPTNIAGKKVDTMNNEYIVVMRKLN